MPTQATPLQEATENVSADVISEQPIIQEAAFEYAGFWVRFAAVLVDGLVLLKQPKFVKKEWSQKAQNWQN